MLFPSPCGDMVLKFLKEETIPWRFVIVSVPLRGYGFEMARWYKRTLPIHIVSVPLRGYGFEIQVNVSVTYAYHMVSVPLRGYGFEIFTEIFANTNEN